MNVLIVDDEKRISDFLMNFARSQGYTDVDTVASANEAMVQAMRQRYDLITLDLSMPDASGLEIIGMLRNMCPHAIIVIISGFLPETVTSEVAGSVDVILAKPVNINALKYLFKSAAQISEIMDKIHLLGTESSEL